MSDLPTAPGAEGPAANKAAKSLENTASRQFSIADLGDGEHRRLLVGAIANILSTDLAEMTYAQIVDGLPTGDVAYEARVALYGFHPIDHAHNELCPGMLEKAREFRDAFQPEILAFDSQVSEIPAANELWLIVERLAPPSIPRLLSRLEKIQDVSGRIGRRCNPPDCCHPL